MTFAQCKLLDLSRGGAACWGRTGGELTKLVWDGAAAPFTAAGSAQEAPGAPPKSCDFDHCKLAPGGMPWRGRPLVIREWGCLEGRVRLEGCNRPAGGQCSQAKHVWGAGSGAAGARGAARTAALACAQARRGQTLQVLRAWYPRARSPCQARRVLEVPKMAKIGHAQTRGGRGLRAC